MSCDCIAELVKMGATHAAAMHADLDREWTNEDWMLHIDEERRLMWPRVIAHHVFYLTNLRGETEMVFGWALVEKLEKEHLALIKDMSDNGTITQWDLVKAHSSLENELLLQMRNAS